MQKQSVFSLIPASSNFTVSGLSKVTGAFTARVLDLQGREVYRRECTAGNIDRMVIETDSWSEGNYLLQLQGESFHTNKRLTVSHR